MPAVAMPSVFGLTPHTSRFMKDRFAPIRACRDYPPPSITIRQLACHEDLRIMGASLKYEGLRGVSKGGGAKIEPFERAVQEWMDRHQVLWNRLCQRRYGAFDACNRAISPASVSRRLAEMKSSRATGVPPAARSYKSADLFAGVMLLGAIGLVANSALSLAEGRLLRWRGTSGG
jgi:hypothetical protein